MRKRSSTPAVTGLNRPGFFVLDSRFWVPRLSPAADCGFLRRIRNAGFAAPAITGPFSPEWYRQSRRPHTPCLQRCRGRSPQDIIGNISPLPCRTGLFQVILPELPGIPRELWAGPRLLLRISGNELTRRRSSRSRAVVGGGGGRVYNCPKPYFP